MLFINRPQDFNPKFEVSSCFCEYDGRILLLHRQDHKPQGNTWSVPAGKVRPGEPLNTSIAREIEEETGARIEEGELSFIDSVYVRYAEYDFVYHMFRAAMKGSEVMLNTEEHKAYCWVTPEGALGYSLIEDEDTCIRMTYGLK